MLRLLFLRLVIAVVASLAITSGVVHAQFEQLATRVPDSANALVVIDVKAVYASPLAKAQSWGQEGQQAHQGGMITLPATAENFLMAAEMDFEFMQPVWEVAVAHVRQMPSMQDVAARSGGRLDRFAGTQAVERTNDSFVVALGPKVIGAMSPANRQHVIRWVRKARSRKSPELSPYLTDALRAASKPSTPIVMALDLHGLLAPAEVARTLAKDETLQESKADVDSLSEVIASIRGISLEVELQNPPQGRLSLDFAQEATILDRLAKPLLLDLLSKYGAGIDEIKSWEVHAAGKSVVLEGDLTKSGLRRVLSVLSSPVGPLATRSKEGGSTNDSIAVASQRYFQAVTSYLDDLFGGNRQPQSLHQVKVWVDRYARKIEDLDTHQVDQDVVAFGLDAVASLHEVVSVVDRAERRSDLREATLYEPGRRRYGRYGTYGYFEKSYVTRDRQLVQADEANRGLQAAHAIVDELRDLTTRTRKTMSERYDRQF